MRKLYLLIALLGTLSIFSVSSAMARPTRVLLVTGDWKSQQWYQDVVMGGKEKYRGRFIEEKVNAAAPGQFTFTEMTNYAGQEYIDANVLSQYDVVLFGDVVGASVPPRTINALKQFVTNGGGFIYCASYKWTTGLCADCQLPDLLPVSLKPPSAKNDDWRLWDIYRTEEKFKPSVKLPDHPIAKGLNWANTPALDKAYVVVPKPGSQVVLTTPKGAPLLVTGNIGAGRTVVSASIFANDELSPDFCEKWQDIGRFYAQTFKWLAANSKAQPRACQTVEGTAQVAVDATKKLNTVSPSLFGFNSVVNSPNLGQLTGVALTNFERLNPRDRMTRFGTLPWFELKRGEFDWSGIDHCMAECARLHLKPEIVTDTLLYVPWIWNGSSYDKATDAQIKECCDWTADLLKRTNHGTGSDPGYKPLVEYVEVANEPAMDATTIQPYIKLYTAIAKRVHKDFPGVKVGALGGYELPYVDWFLEGTKGQVDFIARHPYGWTPEMLFGLQDKWQAYCKSKGFPAPRFIITEWDFWIAGAPKFDYMMKRSFAMVKRTDLIGAMHYRLDQYPEPIYTFGALWAGFGPGTGKKGMPMTDAYDPHALFNCFRGSRVATTVACPDAHLAEHVYADSAITGDGDVSTVVYYDHGYDGNGFTDFAGGKQYGQVKASVTIKLPPQARKRTLTVRTSTGEGMKDEPTKVDVMPNQTDVKVNINLHPHQGTAITIGA